MDIADIFSVSQARISWAALHASLGASENLAPRSELIL
jgi:hypothetical protein